MYMIDIVYFQNGNKNFYNEYFISNKHNTCILILPCSKQRIKKCDFVRYPLKKFPGVMNIS